MAPCVSGRRQNLNTRDTPTTFSTDEAASISQAVKDGNSHPVCPRCGTEMELGPKVSTGGVITQEIVCPDCKRCVMLSDHGEWGAV